VSDYEGMSMAPWHRTQQQVGGPQQLAREHVARFGEKVAMGTLRGVADALGLDSSGGRSRLERTLSSFDAVRETNYREYRATEMADVIAALEFLREFGLSLSVEIAQERARQGASPGQALTR
jgi:hypothetical protein